MLAKDPRNKSLFEVIDEVANDEFESPRHNDATDLDGRVTSSTSSTPPKSGRSSHFFDSSDDNEQGDSNSQESDPNSPDVFSWLHVSDGFTTPPRSPKKQDPKTPDAEKAVKSLSRIIDGNDPGYDLSPTSKKKFNNALKTVNTWKSPHKGKDTVRKLFSATLEKTGAIAKVSAGGASSAIFATKNPEDIRGEWTLELSKPLKFSFLDVKHLEDLERNGGFHICSAAHPRDRFVVSRRTNLLTGVWCGQVCAEKDPNKILKKFTSFIPREMTLEQYQQLIADAKGKDIRIAEQGNRCLYRVGNDKNSFVVECYLQEGGAIIKSAIPVFHYETYNGKDKSFKIEYTSKRSLADNDALTHDFHEVIYDRLFELLKTHPEAIVYDTKDKIVVDMGLLYNTHHAKYGSCPIDQGLLVEISKEFLV
jgi:hypothetical protein